MIIEQIKKRNGAVVAFDRAKIELAMSKAFTATETPQTQDTLRLLTDEVILEAESRFASSIPTVEDMQDIVERALAGAGYFTVAKAYIIYRKERAEAREEEKIKMLERIEKSALKVKKRDGRTVRFNIDDIEKAVTNVARQFPNLAVDVEGILQDCKVGI